MTWTEGGASEEVFAHLSRCELFSGLPFESVSFFIKKAQLQSFSRGSLLIRQGESADALYVISEGTAEILLEHPDQPDELIDILGPGEFIGDLAILLDQPRTATVRASRFCKVVRLDRADFTQLFNNVPEFSQRLASLLAQRLQRTTRERITKRSVSDILVIMAQASPLVKAIAHDLALAIAALQNPSITLRIIEPDQPREWHQALAESDCTLLLVDASGPHDLRMINEALDAADRAIPRPMVDLVLCHGQNATITGTRNWLSDPRLRRFHHARANTGRDCPRIARLIAGCATGLALSGGGARGFAHIGVIIALQEKGIVIDYVAGTSMGAIMAAQLAAGLSTDEMIAATYKGYVEVSGLPDYTIPTVALYSGRKTARKLHAMFGDRTIEDLPTPYFAVAADLRTASTVVLDSGLVWEAGRLSTSVPGLLPPVLRDGMILVDGGLLDNLPVEELARRCGGRVIASDVSVAIEFGDLKNRGLCRKPHAGAVMPGIGQIMMRTAQLASVRDSRKSGTPADLYINPELNDVGMSDFRRITEIVERGRIHAHLKLADWGL